MSSPVHRPLEEYRPLLRVLVRGLPGAEPHCPSGKNSDDFGISRGG